jgi:hypothetical protein
MNIFKKKHLHAFHYDPVEAYKKAWTDMFDNHIMKPIITETCRCGAERTTEVSLSLMFDISTRETTKHGEGHG